MDPRLNAELTPGKFVSISRPFGGEPRHNGLLLGVGESLVLLLQFHDFYPEGYTVIRKEDILEACSSERESYWEFILRREGIINRVETSFDVPLNNMRSFLETQRGQYLILECESRISDNDEFYIGQLNSLGNGSASLKTFDSLGVWDELTVDITYDAITKVQFNTPYINIMTKYLSYSGEQTGDQRGQGDQRGHS